MTNIKISQLPSEPSPSPTDLVPIVKSATLTTEQTPLSAILALIATGSNGWTALPYTPNSVTYNGNRSYGLVFNSVDLTGTLSSGMRMKSTRTVGAPTQCTSLNGTTQSYSKSSPTGMTFTTAYTAMAWVKLAAYSGSDQYIMSRFSTTGWRLRILATGQVAVRGDGASNREFTSSQSVPLNKMIHIAATLDMAAGTANIYFDGILIPSTSTGSTGTSLTQAGNLEIGTSAGAGFFNGKIVQAAIFSAVLTQATIQSYISQSLAGTESSLISAYSFNNSINDLNATNANNLTANGSAVATNADSPFGGQAGGGISSTLDYAIIQSVNFSTNTTIVVQVPEGCTIPTSGGVTSVGYSGSKAPYGMPMQRRKWSVFALILGAARSSQASAVAGTWYNVGSTQLNVPIGEWELSHSSSPIVAATTGSEISATLSTANNTASNPEFIGQSFLASTATFGASIYKSRPVSVTTATTYFHNLVQQNGSSVTLFNADSSAFAQPIIIQAENAYL